MATSTPPATRVRTSQELGALITQVRQSQALLQSDVAGLAGTGNCFIDDLERGKPTLQLQKVLDTLDLMGLEVVVQRKNPFNRWYKISRH